MYARVEKITKSRKKNVTASNGIKLVLLTGQQQKIPLLKNNDYRHRQLEETRNSFFGGGEVWADEKNC